MNTIEIIEKEIGYVAEVEERTFVWKMPSVMQKNFALLCKYTNCITHKEEEISLYARYVDFNWQEQLSKGVLGTFVDILFNKWHYFTGTITNEKIINENSIQSNKIESRKYIKAIHYGEYRKVSDTYRKICDYAKEKNIKIENESFEFYLNDPSKVKKEDIKTMVLIPIVK